MKTKRFKEERKSEGWLIIESWLNPPLAGSIMLDTSNLAMAQQTLIVNKLPVTYHNKQPKDGLINSKEQI